MDYRYTLRLLMVILSLLVGACSSKDQPQAPSNPDLTYTATGSAQTAVIFVHGIMGHAATTFQAEGSQQGWPQLLATDPALASPVEVISVGYASHPLERAGNINEIATRLRSRLLDLNVFTRFSKVVFVSHSMGGLVTRRMLMQLSQDNTAAFAKVTGVFFFATPAGGSDLAALTSWVSKNPQFGNMAPADVNTFLQAEDDDWAALLRRRTAPAFYPRTFCIYETQAMGNTVIVPRSRSQNGCDERPEAFERNHSTLVKPANRHDDVYVYLLARINRLITDQYVPLTVTASLLSASGQTIPTPAALASGDQYSIDVRSTRPAWFYVVCENSDGTVERYFPSKALGTQSTPQKTLLLPAERGKKFTLDKTRGFERIHIFASINTNEAFERLDAELRTAPAHAGEVVKRALQLRNSYLADAAPPKTAVNYVSVTDLGGEPAASLVILHK